MQRLIYSPAVAATGVVVGGTIIGAGGSGSVDLPARLGAGAIIWASENLADSQANCSSEKGGGFGAGLARGVTNTRVDGTKAGGFTLVLAGSTIVASTVLVGGAVVAAGEEDILLSAPQRRETDGKNNRDSEAVSRSLFLLVQC